MPPIIESCSSTVDCTLQKPVPRRTNQKPSASVNFPATSTNLACGQMRAGTSEGGEQCRSTKTRRQLISNTLPTPAARGRQVVSVRVKRGDRERCWNECWIVPGICSEIQLSVFDLNGIITQLATSKWSCVCACMCTSLSPPPLHPTSLPSPFSPPLYLTLSLSLRCVCFCLQLRLVFVYIHTQNSLYIYTIEYFTGATAWGEHQICKKLA